MFDVSVVIPTHNRLHLLPQAVSSVLGQTGIRLELIVVDDGSHDGTGEWLRRLAADEHRLKVVHHASPQLTSAARNAGIERASARWVAFCDDDDLWAPDKLATQVRALESKGARWSCTGVVEVSETLEIFGHHRARGGDVLPALLENNMLPSGSTVVADRQLVRQVGGFDPTLRSSEDWDLWIRLAQHSPLAAVDRPLIAYRLGPATMSMNVDRMRQSRATIVDRYAPLAIKCGVTPTELKHERYLAKQLLRSGSRRAAASIFASLAIKHGRWREFPRVAAALLAPRLTDRLGRARTVAAIPEAWQKDVEAWLGPLRATEKRSLVEHH
jgi:glycosyltransferase involved in cell wall biosynthesis